VNHRCLIVWTLLLALVVGAYYYSGSRERSDAKAKDEQARLVTAIIEPLNVTSLDLRGLEVPQAIHIERRDDQQRWVLTAPVGCEAYNLAVNRVIGSLLEARVSQRIAPKGPMADFGLDPPRLAVTLTDRRGVKAEVLVGDLSPSKEHLYAALPGSGEVLLLSASLRGEVARTLFDLRSKAALDFVAGELKRVELKDQRQTLVLEKAETSVGARWSLVGHGEASERAVDDLLHQIHGLQAMAILDDGINLTRIGLERPARSLTLTMKDGSSIGLVVGGPLPAIQGTYTRRLEGGPVMVLKSEALAHIQRQPRDLLERRVLIFERDQVQGLSIARGDQTQVYEKKEGRWRRTQPSGGGESFGEAISLFLWDLADLKLERLLASHEAEGLDNPAAVIKLTLVAFAGNDSPVQKRILVVGQAQPGREMVAAKVEGDSRIFGISSNFISMIPFETEQAPAPEGPGGAKEHGPAPGSGRAGRH
jgi:hypothetical protein